MLWSLGVSLVIGVISLRFISSIFVCLSCFVIYEMRSSQF